MWLSVNFKHFRPPTKTILNEITIVHLNRFSTIFQMFITNQMIVCEIKIPGTSTKITIDCKYKRQPLLTIAIFRCSKKIIEENKTNLLSSETKTNISFRSLTLLIKPAGH